MLNEKAFNKKEYDYNYLKEHYGTFSAKLKKDETKKINELLKEKNMNKAEFVRWAYNKLKK